MAHARHIHGFTRKSYWIDVCGGRGRWGESPANRPQCWILVLSPGFFGDYSLTPSALMPSRLCLQESSDCACSPNRDCLHHLLPSSPSCSFLPSLTQTEFLPVCFLLLRGYSLGPDSSSRPPPQSSYSGSSNVFFQSNLAKSYIRVWPWLFGIIISQGLVWRFQWDVLLGSFLFRIS